MCSLECARLLVCPRILVCPPRPAPSPALFSPSQQAKQAINISYMSVSRDAKSKLAIMAIGVDSTPSADVSALHAVSRCATLC